MRVLFVSLALFGGKSKGGGERYVSELAKALIGRGIEVDVLAVPKLTEITQLNRINGEQTEISLSEFFRIAKRADVIHVHQLNTPGFDYSFVYSLFSKTPLVLTDHGGGALTPGRALKSLRLKAISAAAFVSEWSQDDIDPKRIIKKTAIIYGGGDHLPKDATKLPLAYDFGFVGRILPHKGLHVVVDALPDNASLVIVGQARDANYLKKIKASATGKRITFFEDASDGLVASVMKSIRYLTIPSVSHYGDQRYVRPELLGLVALEALAAGTPVIGSDVGGLAELLRRAQQTVVADGDVAAWNSSMCLALESGPPEISTNLYTWDAVANKCISLYNEI